MNLRVSDPLPRCANGADSCALDEVAFDPALTAQFDDPTLADLEAATGVGWRAVELPADSHFVDFNAIFEEEGSRSAVYVVETLERSSAGDTLVSVASNDGFVLWVNGTLAARSRFDGGSRHPHSSLVQARLQQGTNTLLYKVVQHDGIWTLHREYHPLAAADSLFPYAADENAFADLPLETVLPDTATAVLMRLPATWLDEAPHYVFRWTDLLGEPVFGEEMRYVGRFPERLPLPEGFPGMAVMELEVREADTGRRITGEVIPIFHRSTADRMARSLSASAWDDPVGEARRMGVREIFRLDPDTVDVAYVTRHQGHALADLYRYVHDRDRIALYPGPQIWGYRSPSDGSVQPFRLHVPGAGIGRTVYEPESARPVLFFLNHWTNPVFWRGRGHSPGWYVEWTAYSTNHDVLSVVPQLRGEYNFRPYAVEDFEGIRSVLRRHFTVDPTRVGVLGASNHFGQLVDIMRQMDTAFTHVASFGPAPDMNMTDLQPALDSLYQRHPDIEWFIRSGAQDEVVPGLIAEIIEERLRRAGYPVDYAAVPHSGHWDMSVNVIAELFGLLSTQER